MTTANVASAVRKSPALFLDCASIRRSLRMQHRLMNGISSTVIVVTGGANAAWSLSIVSARAPSHFCYPDNDLAADGHCHREFLLAEAQEGKRSAHYARCQIHGLEKKVSSTIRIRGEYRWAARSVTHERSLEPPRRFRVSLRRPWSMTIRGRTLSSGRSFSPVLQPSSRGLSDPAPIPLKPASVPLLPPVALISTARAIRLTDATIYPPRLLSHGQRQCGWRCFPRLRNNYAGFFQVAATVFELQLRCALLHPEETARIPTKTSLRKSVSRNDSQPST